MLFSDPTFWVAVSFLGFVGLALYLRAPDLVLRKLDENAKMIENELEEAQRLREEAQLLLADYQRKHWDAEQEASAIIAAARADAARYSEEARSALKELLDRRTASAESRILQAEKQAILSIRSTVVDTAVSAAEKMILDKLKEDTHKKVIDSSIADIKHGLGSSSL